MKICRHLVFASLLVSIPVPAAWSENGDMVQTGSDIPAKWQKPDADYDCVKREVMIPMRDGIKLHTVIVIPKQAQGLPILLERTPYDATFFAGKDSPHLRDVVWAANREWVDDGYIFVYQDIRGKYGSERLVRCRATCRKCIQSPTYLKNVLLAKQSLGTTNPRSNESRLWRVAA